MANSSKFKHNQRLNAFGSMLRSCALLNAHAFFFPILHFFFVTIRISWNRFLWLCMRLWLLLLSSVVATHLCWKKYENVVLCDTAHTLRLDLVFMQATAHCIGKNVDIQCGWFDTHCVHRFNFSRSVRLFFPSITIHFSINSMCTRWPFDVVFSTTSPPR